jgi:hypothetical protein
MHDHLKKPKPSYDLLEHMRKPHGILILAVVIGVAGWAIWTFFFSARIVN